MVTVWLSGPHSMTAATKTKQKSLAAIHGLWCHNQGPRRKQKKVTIDCFSFINGRHSGLVCEYYVVLSQDEDRATALINTENIKKFFNKSYSLEQLCSVQLPNQSGIHEYDTHTHTHTHTCLCIHTCTFTLHAVFTVPKQVHNFAPRENSVWLKTVRCDACWQQRYPPESFMGRTVGNTDVKTSKLTMASGLWVPLFQTTQHHIQENCDLHLHLKTVVIFCLLTYKL
jgi:hypothetical protein